MIYLNDKALIEALLSELRYVLTTGNIPDSESNSLDLRQQAAKRLGFFDYAAFEEACRAENLRPYRVSLHEWRDGGKTSEDFIFECQAEDEDHAREQANKAHPDADVDGIELVKAEE